ncbi:hypothetical protein L227DRAFT_183712 [Lentinus tigrinus ALCF2SS1-6]|uniref:Uncharacterized protein n=1 Tax=Lentinus tigrinus ALCF2SS1-6 TaxID=1328759 RepID=A0A5C2S649_9APHY|nr:hypothetical protein L227DRAFT_183712 [Lentinus tigrinus ALCF2SS1-6]
MSTLLPCSAYLRAFCQTRLMRSRSERSPGVRVLRYPTTGRSARQAMTSSTPHGQVSSHELISPQSGAAPGAVNWSPVSPRSPRRCGCSPLSRSTLALGRDMPFVVRERRLGDLLPRPPSYDGWRSETSPAARVRSLVYLPMRCLRCAVTKVDEAFRSRCGIWGTGR